MSVVPFPGDSVFDDPFVQGILSATRGGDLEALLLAYQQVPPGDWLHEELGRALIGLGPILVDPALDLWAEADSHEERGALAGLLAACGTRDPRILEILVVGLGEAPGPAALQLARYGDPAALPSLSAALDALALTPEAADLEGLVYAIEELGGVLTPAQAEKWEAIARLRERAPEPEVQRLYLVGK